MVFRSTLINDNFYRLLIRWSRVRVSPGPPSKDRGYMTLSSCSPFFWLLQMQWLYIWSFQACLILCIQHVRILCNPHVTRFKQHSYVLNCLAVAITTPQISSVSPGFGMMSGWVTSPWRAIGVLPERWGHIKNTYAQSTSITCRDLVIFQSYHSVDLKILTTKLCQ